jgi:drug/metabolite transporter (DMT)-like permease
MFALPEYAPAAGFILYWALIGFDICPPWPWPRPWPGPPPPPWPPWFSLVGIVAAIVSGLVFTNLAGVGTSPGGSIVEFATTGVFAAVGAFAARALSPLVSQQSRIT